MKKFWKKTEGFTLVELIVVIAILGILAGVGTVGYSGYIKKANMAADQQLVRDVAVALELGTYAGTNTKSGYVILGTEAPVYVEGGTSNTISSKELEDCLKAVFGDDLSGLILKTEWNVNYADSVFCDNETELLTQVDTLTGTLAEVFKTTGTADFVNFSQYLADNGLSDASDSQQASAAVLYVSQKTAGLSAENEKNYLDNIAVIKTDFDNALPGVMNSFGGMNSVAGLAALYAHMEGYYQYEYEKTGDRTGLDAIQNAFVLAPGEVPPATVGEALVLLGAAYTEANTNSIAKGWDRTVANDYYGNGQAVADAKAYLEIMDNVSAAEQLVLDEIVVSTEDAPFSYATSGAVTNIVTKIKDGSVAVFVNVSDGKIEVFAPVLG